MMYNESLKSYTLDRALEMICLDRENWLDDYLYTGSSESWLSFLADPGLEFFLTGKGSIPLGLTLTDVFKAQYGALKIDLAIAFALVVRNSYNAISSESLDIALQVGHLLYDLRVLNAHPGDTPVAEVNRDQLFRIYQIRRRLRNAFRNISFLGSDEAEDADRILKMYLAEIEDYLEAHLPEDDWPLNDVSANTAIDNFVLGMEERTGYGSILRGILRRRGVLVSIPDEDSEDDCDI